MAKLNKAEFISRSVWITLINKYPAKCYVCNQYISNNVMIKWHARKKLTRHKDYCL